MNEQLVIYLIGAALALYLIASLLYSGELYSRHRFHGRFATLATIGGFLAHSAAIAALIVGEGGFSVFYCDVTSSCLLFGWVLVGAYLLVQLWIKSKALGAIALPVVIFTMLASAAIHAREPEPRLDTALESHMIAVHVLSILVGYASFAVAFCAAVIYLVEHRRLKAKKLDRVFDHLPSLERTDALAARMAALGFPLLTLGLALGINSAQRVVDYAWMAEPKMIMSLIIWLSYAIYLANRRFFGWTGRKANYLIILGFVLIVLAYVGGLTLGSGLHGIRFLEHGRR